MSNSSNIEASAETPLAEELLDIVEAIDDGLALFAANERLIYCNARFRELHQGVLPPQPRGMPWEIFYRLASSRAMAQGLEQVDHHLRIGSRRSFSVEAPRPGDRWARIEVRPTRGHGFVLIESDITDQRASEELRAEYEALVRDVLDACAANIIMSRVADGYIHYLSPNARTLFGDSDDARTLYATDIGRADYLTALLPTAAVDAYEVQLLRADGSIFPASVAGRLVSYAGEDVIVSSIQDMTVFYRQRDEIVAANQRLIDAIEALREGFVLFDAEGRLVMANEVYRRALEKWAPSARSGTTHTEIVDAATRSGFFKGPQPDSQFFELSGERGMGRIEIETSDDRIFLVSRFPTVAGATVFTWLDITEARRAEAAQREADALVRTIVEASPTTFLVSRLADGTIIYMPPVARERFGDIKTTSDCFVDTDEHAAYLTALLTSGTLTEYRARFKRRDGQVMECLTSARVVDYKGEALVVSSTQDITEQLRMAAELKEQRDLAHQHEKMSALGELLAGVAHELNNPLSVIIGQALMLSEEVETPHQKASIERLRTAAERSAKIVRTFLALARQRPMQLSTTSINDIVETAVDVVEGMFERQGIELTTHLDASEPGVRADADQLAQVVINLLVNAEQATRDLERVSQLKVETAVDVDGSVLVKVADNGPGVPDDLKPRIFEPFFTTKDVGKGTGIGLALSHRIVASHGGTLSVADTPQGGAVFTIALPPAVDAEPDRTARRVSR